MKKIACILFVFSSLSLFGNENIIKELESRISDCENSKELLTDSSDIYTHYYILGKQSAYHECVELLLKEKSLIGKK